MTNSIGVVSKLFGKLAKGSSVLNRQQCHLKAGYGIEGDIHANPQSPRQVLIMRQEDLQQGSLGFGPIAAIDPGQFSENILIKGIPASQFVPGAELRFAGGAAIRLTFYCEPCKRIAGLVWSLSDIAQKRGILGVVVNDGVLAVGAEFMIQSGVFEALSEIPYQRFLDFLAKIPNKAATGGFLMTTPSEKRATRRASAMLTMGGVSNTTVSNRVRRSWISSGRRTE